MRWLLVLLALPAILVLLASPALARPVVHVTGGGRHLRPGPGRRRRPRRVAVRDRGGARRGRRGSRALRVPDGGASDILGLPLMAVEAKVTAGSADPRAGTASFGGVARVNGTIFSGVPIRVEVGEGPAGTGTMRLTVIGAFDGVPGDQIPASGNYDLPTETVERGRIDVH